MAAGGIGLYRSSPRSLRTCGESLFLPTSNPLQPIGQRPDSSQPFSEASQLHANGVGLRADKPSGFGG